ncbi:nuclear pore complex protein NUP50A [Telopea speciosissima]|uniref:nuclear pore complex protein NUP50A n=1 Tax=Telopea speciosissima TaxID=54955 RepID=UPI001CC555D6|nr:nuclear pore complex protein NUP50A [Telopea speciosissima]XP_043698676.1 nuclear pore complex protein NUP50A [Telopea speciosissima]
MGDSENTVPPSKKRVAGRELSRDNPGLDDEDESPEQETGTFKRASDEVLAARRIVKVRRQQPPAAASSNPFAAIRLVPPPTESSTKPAEVITESHPGEQKVSEEAEVTSDVGTDTEKGLEITEPKRDQNDKPSETRIDEPKAESDTDKKKSGPVDEVSKPESGEEKEVVDETEEVDKEENGQPNAASPLSSFQQLSSNQNAFTGLVGTGFSSSSFSFGSIPKDGSGVGFGSGSGSLFGLKNDKPSSYPSFSFGSSNNGSPSVFRTGGESSVAKSEGGGPSLQEVQVETGEENEKAVFSADAVLFEYLDGGWKERGKGELKVNVSTTGTEKARLIMRARGNLRLILNASLYPDMKFTNMDKKGITFACINSTGECKEGLSTFALKFKDGSIMEEFRGEVMAHKCKKTTVLKTPENSPKASDD